MTVTEQLPEIADAERSLRDRDQRLTAQIDALTAERVTVRQALAGLAPLVRPVPPRTPRIGGPRQAGAVRPGNTKDVIAAYAEHLGPDKPVRSEALLVWATTQVGWSSPAKDQRGALSCMMVRAAEQGLIRKEGRGNYCTWPEGGRAAVEAAARL